MARGVNKVIIIGSLGKDPECRYMPSGGAVANISVATSEKWKDKQTGEQKERTEWHNVVFYNRLAEIAGEYLKKGSQAYIEGSLRTRKWQDKTGQDRYTTEIIASEMQMLGGRASGGSDNNQQQSGGFNQAPQQQAQQPAHTQGSRFQQQPQQPQQGRQQQGGQALQQQGGGFDDFDDDIPF